MSVGNDKDKAIDNSVSEYPMIKRRQPNIPTPINMPKKALLYSIFILD